MVLLTALIGELHAQFRVSVDIVTSGPWSEPLLAGQPGVGAIWSLRSRKTPYWLAADQRRVVRALRRRGRGPTWFCDADGAARHLMVRAGITDEYVVDVKDHPLRHGEHATQQWRRMAAVLPPVCRERPLAGAPTGLSGCRLEVSAAQRADLEAWLLTRGLHGVPLLLVQVGNKRTMRRGTRRLAVNHKYWPLPRWAAVIRHLRAGYPEHRIALLGTGPEYALNQEVAALAGVDGLANVADDLPVPRLIALLEKADGLVTVDSGPAHAAAAVGCPQVVLFGKAPTWLYRPWGSTGAAVEVLCGRRDGELSMLGIEAEAVIAAWDALPLRRR
jgi:heptosyltransferase-2/heptosyltransferase-3